MHILLFGGAFNPPHLGHAIVIEQAFELIPSLDELWLLPAYNHAFSKTLAPAADRLAMCNSLVRSLDSQIVRSLKVKVCPLEIDFKPEGSTYQTLHLLKSNPKYIQEKMFPNYPATQLPNDLTYSFLMGSDQLPTFDKWINYQQLLQEMHFYVYPRGSHRHDVTFPNMELLESPTQVITNISSTLVKHRLAKQLSVSRTLPQTITSYIQEHHLYVPSSSQD